MVELFLLQLHASSLSTTFANCGRSPNVFSFSPARIVEELIFGSDYVSWGTGTALGEAGLLADYLILKTGMTALGPIYHQTQQDVMIHVSYSRWCLQQSGGGVCFL